MVNYGHNAKFCTVKLNCGGPKTGKETGNADQKDKSGLKIRLSTRFNRILKSLLRTRVNTKKNDWDEQLPHALLAYRVTVQASTNMSPFECCMVAKQDYLLELIKKC